MPDDRRSDEDLDRELIELLNELRVALPGVQVLFAFLLAVPFAQRFGRVTDVQKDAYMVSLLCTTLGSVLLIAPSTYHRILWRQHDKEHMLKVANGLAIAGSVFLAVAMTAAVFLITDVLFGNVTTLVVTVATAVAFGWFWYLMPLQRMLRRRED